MYFNSYSYKLNMFIVFIAFTLFITTGCSRSLENTVTIPLTWQKSQLFRMLEDRTIHQYFPQFGYSSENPKPWTNDTINVYKFLNYEFYGKVSIGHPAQSFKMQIDTLWADTWVTSSDYNSACIPCSFKTRYDHSRSSTYKELNDTYLIKTKSGSFVGYLSQDTIVFAHLNVTNQIFAEITTLPFSYIYYESDGLLGLAFQALSPKGIVPVIENLYRQKKIINPVFSIYINRDFTTDRGGSILLGAVDKHHYKGSFTYVRVTSQYYWQFSMDRIFIVISKKKLYPLCEKGCQAMIDASTSLISGPTQDIQSINKYIGVKLYVAGRGLLRCSQIRKLPHIAFVFGGRTFNLTGIDYTQVLEIGGIEFCLSPFVASDAFANTWTLGASFLSSFYSTYNFQERKIGFAVGL